LEKISKVPGIINLLNSHNNLDTSIPNLTWRDCIAKFRVKGSEISLITSGKKTVGKDEKGYSTLVRELDVEKFEEEKEGGECIEALRDGWKAEYDYVLVDSRTGVTDIGGICTIHLPDVLVLMFGANEQNLAGTIDVARKAARERNKIPFDRFSLITFPISSRFDSQAEFEISQEWLNKFGVEFKYCYASWLPKDIESREFVEITKIPYIPYFSFGEKLPVIEQGISDPTSLGFAYETIASIIADNFENIEMTLQNRGLINKKRHLDEISAELTASRAFYKGKAKLQTGVDTRGVLSIVTMLVSLAAISIALFGGSKLIFDILEVGLEKVYNIPVKVIVIALPFVFGWVTGLVSIRGFGNLIYPVILNIYAWGCLIVTCNLYFKIILQLFAHNYTGQRFGTYIMLLAGILFVVVCLYQLAEGRDLRPFAIPLLIISVVQLFVIVYNFMFDLEAGGMSNLLGDLTVFLFMITVSGLMLISLDFGILSRVRGIISDLFHKEPEIKHKQ